MVKMIKVNMTSWSTCERSTWHDGQHVKGQHDKEQQDEKVHPQVTIAVPDVGEENTGQGHHHLIGEKPRWPNIFTLFNFEESTPFGSFESNVDDPLGFQGPPAQATVEKEQGSSQIPGLAIHPCPHHHQTFRFHFTSQLTLNLFPSSTFSYPIAQNDLQYIYCYVQGIKIISKSKIKIEISLAGH